MTCPWHAAGSGADLQQGQQLQAACRVGAAGCAAPVPGACATDHQECIQPGGHQEACAAQCWLCQLHEEEEDCQRAG